MQFGAPGMPHLFLEKCCTTGYRLEPFTNKSTSTVPYRERLEHRNQNVFKYSRNLTYLYPFPSSPYPDPYYIFRNTSTRSQLASHKVS